MSVRVRLPACPPARLAPAAQGRPILFSMCNWGVDSPHLWGYEVGNSWRTGRDVFATWDEHAARKVLRLPGFLQSLETAIEQQAGYAANAGPGGFNDPDMLVVGLDGMTPCAHARSHPSHHTRLLALSIRARHDTTAPTTRHAATAPTTRHAAPARPYAMP